MEAIQVSGCIVTYNEEDIIEECVASLLARTQGVDFTLTISDNCSQDRTVPLLEEKFPQITIRRNEKNGGFGYGHNQVLDTLTSKYHVVINPDIILKEDAISNMVDYMEEHPEVGMITPKVLNFDGTEQFLPKRNPSIRYVVLSKFKPFRKHRQFYTRELDQLNTPTEVEVCSGCFFLIRTELFQRIRGFDNRYYMYFEDADISRMVRQEGYPLIFYPETNVYHKWNRANTRSVKGIVRFLTSMVKYFQKWGWKWN